MADKIRASHILVKTEGEVNDLKSQIDDGADFASLAREHSDCPSGAEGGDLGSFGHGAMVAEFDKAAFDLEVGDVSGSIKTQFGYHLIHRTE
jgi:parvulin-like peptidyl-prolyl isomerase